MPKHNKNSLIWSSIIIMIIFAQVSFGEIAQIEADGVCGKINIDTKSDNFGSLISINDKEKSYIKDICLFSLQYGILRGKEREIIKHTADELCLRVSGFSPCPLIAELTYHTNRKAIVLNVKAWVTEPYTFTSNLSLIMNAEYKNVTVKGIGAEEETFNLNKCINNNTRKSKIINCLNSHYKFYNSLTDIFSIVIRNPFHSLWEFNSPKMGNHQLVLTPTLFPQGPYSSRTQEGPMISSKMNPSDTIFRRIEITPHSKPEIPVGFNEHSNGWSQCITMYWDELPNRDNWAFMTTAEANDVKYDHYFVRLMNEHPQLKMGYLVIADRMLYRYKADVEHWNTHCAYSIPDSLDASNGNWCMFLNASKKRTIKISQDISCKPHTDYTLHYKIKTNTIIGVGAYGEVYGANDTLILSDTHHLGTENWQTRKITFTTGDNDTTIRVYLRIEKSVGQAYFDDVSLYETCKKQNLIRNGDFEDNDPRFVYDNKRRHWSDAHGPLHLASSAPEKYLDFLKRIENNELKFGWEERVSLGCHGYHHTPSLHKPNNPKPGWEFQYYDPEGDKLRMNRIFNDIQQIGLTRKSLRYWRSPGFKYTKSLLDLTIDSGFVFFDIGIKDFFYSIPLQRDGKRLWAVSTCWWADKKDNHSLKTFKKNLGLGHLAQIGGHPEAIFYKGTETSYQRIHNILSDVEKQFPNMGYVLPDTYSDNANSIYDLKILNISRAKRNITFSFQGKVRRGNSIVFEGTCTRALFNGKDVQVKNNGPVLYVILPEAADEVHTLELVNAKVLTPNNISIRAFHLKTNALSFYLKRPSIVESEIYTLSGKKVYNTDPKRFNSFGINTLYFENRTSLAPGIYLFRLKVDGKCMDIKKINILRY